MSKWVACLLFVSLVVPLMAEDEWAYRTELIRPREIDSSDDDYMQGYLQGMIDLYYLEHCVNVCVDGRTVYLSNLPQDMRMRRAIIDFVRDFPCVECVVIDDDCCCTTKVARPTPRIDCCCLNGIWFPEHTRVYPPMIADPRRIQNGIGYRFHDDVFGGRIAVAILGDHLPIYRWLNVGPCCGPLQVGIEAGAWAVFKFESGRLMEDDDSIALQNTDFVAAIPLEYACGCWSYRFRLYHTSSHLGDEFIVMHPGVKRLNPSREAIDLFAAYQITSGLRIYGGLGYNIRSNFTFEIDPWYVEYGFELHLFAGRNLYTCGYIDPFLAVFVRNWQDWSWKFDATYALGFEWSKFRGVGRKLRLYLEYHDGFSLEGQFSKLRTEYFAIKLSWGF